MAISCSSLLWTILILHAVSKHYSQLNTAVTYYYKKYADRKLNTFTSRYYTANTIVTCSLLCQNDKTCLSFNYGTEVNKSFKSCELLPTTEGNNPFFLTSEGMGYYRENCDMQGKQKINCFNGGTPRELENTHCEFVCDCPLMTQGPFCENTCSYWPHNYSDLYGMDIKTEGNKLDSTTCLDSCSTMVQCKSVLYLNYSKTCYYKSESQFTKPDKVSLTYKAQTLYSKNCSFP